MEREEGLKLFGETRIMAMFRNVERDRVIPFAEALYDGGIRMIEVTLNSIGAYYVIKDLQKQLGKRVFIGAGAVCDAKDAKEALEAGASFLVAPYTDKRVVKFGQEERLPVYAGALTPAEVAKAWKSGVTGVSLFPAASLGAAYASELREALPHIPLLAAGGINEGNLAEYLRAGCAGCELDAARINRLELKDRHYDVIRDRAAALSQIVRQTQAELEAVEAEAD
ncbi:MAG: 2-dehydro-3-deoxyphosphogluconate aldolase [Paenibacillaceae bacterium]|nr:2-dehydro-3-deoxyphosphogluconate aldolase [Paenibacillaceae bacterium]